MLSWSKLTSSISNGGLGLPEIECLNQAMLPKHISRVFSNPSGLLSRIIIQKDGRGFLESITDPHTNTSWRRKDIQKEAAVIIDELF